VALAVVALYLGVFLGPAQTPHLGLDLRGGTEITLTAHPIGSGKITKSALNQAVDIIRQRVSGLGVSNASVNTQGSNNIVVEVPGKGHSVLNSVGETALLRFRQVMEFIPGLPTTTTPPSPTTSPSATSTAKPGKNGKHTKNKHGKQTKKNKKSTSSQGRAVSSVLEKATPSPTPTPTTTSPSPAASAPTTAGQTSQLHNEPLPGSQSPTLNAAFTKSFNNWDCTKNPNPTEGNDNPTDYIIACDTTPLGGLKYLLAPASVEGTQVSGASSGIGTTNQWQVNLSFNGSGSTAWQKVTAAAYKINNGVSETPGTCNPPAGCNGVAIVLDGVVQSAPYISQPGGIAGGSAQISGNFTQKTAGNLANILKYGALPLKFDAADVQTVSATLGAAQLRGGLTAGIIGLALVIIFSLLYYRALGLVTVGSLAVSGLILYAVTTLLGQSSVGYTLSLPGIAGFIVAVGITADSFVVFFERLRDEIREGRRLRSGVERAWPRARRTILSADTVSLLAAFVLYIVSIGDVRGFAFTLGISTLSDLFIVFFFTKPLLTVLARRPAFDSGKPWTGVGKARAGVERDVEPEPERARRRPRTPRATEA
jgi:preprotein translocase subunit SecD